MFSCRAAVLAVLAVLAFAAPAHAGKVTYGSDLSLPATIDHSHPRDWAAWPTAVQAGGSLVAPAAGEVSMVQLRGTILKPDNDAAYNGRYPEFGVHIVVLRPQDDGTLKLAGASNELPFPFGGDDQQITTYDLQQYEAKVCVVPGDIVAFSTEGGFGSAEARYGGFPDDYFGQGYHVKMFSGARTSRTGFFREDPTGTFQVGDSVKSTDAAGEELLMRTTVSTAADARWFCRTKAQQDANLPSPGATPTPTPAPDPSLGSPAKLVPPAGHPQVRSGKVRFGVRCAGPYACTGTLSLGYKGKAGGATPFTLEGAATAALTVKLKGALKGKLRGRGSHVTVNVKVKTPAASTARHYLIQRA